MSGKLRLTSFCVYIEQKCGLSVLSADEIRKDVEYGSLFSNIQTWVAVSIAPNEGQHPYIEAHITWTPLRSGLANLTLGGRGVQGHSQVMGNGAGGSE